MPRAPPLQPLVLEARHAHAGASGAAAPHLAAAQQAASRGHALPKAARLGAVGRVRHMGLLNGVIPGSSAAAAAVSLYNGNAGEYLHQCSISIA